MSETEAWAMHFPAVQNRTEVPQRTDLGEKMQILSMMRGELALTDVWERDSATRQAGGEGQPQLWARPAALS